MALVIDKPAHEQGPDAHLKATSPTCPTHPPRQMGAAGDHQDLDDRGPRSSSTGSRRVRRDVLGYSASSRRLAEADVGIEITHECVPTDA
jgi:hypothetical protein